MPDSTAAPGYPVPLSPMFIWSELKAQAQDFTRRVDALGIRLDHLDQYGTRGVEALGAEVRQLRTDMEAHETLHDRQHTEQLSARRWFIGILVTLLVPLYPAIGYVIIVLARR